MLNTKRIKTEHKTNYRVKAGDIAEKLVVKELRELGYSAKQVYHAGFDVLAHKGGRTIKIEVKYAGKAKADNKYRATCIKNDKHGQTDSRKSDFIIMICETTAFVIPSSFQGNKSSICITSNPVTYTGKYSPFREAWNLL